MALEFKYSKSQLASGIANMTDKIGAAVLMYAATKASQIEAQMKTRRPWADITGEAKRQLTVKVSRPSETIVRMTLAHGVDYGIWLELAHEKKYAIIAPTVKTEGPLIVADLTNIMSSIGS